MQANHRTRKVLVKYSPMFHATGMFKNAYNHPYAFTIIEYIHYITKSHLFCICCFWILILWQKRYPNDPQRSRGIVKHHAKIELSTLRLNQHRQLLVVQHVHSTPPRLSPKRQLTTRSKWTCVSFNSCFNFELRLDFCERYTCFVLMLWQRETHITCKGAAKLVWNMQGLNSQRLDWGNIASCQLFSTLVRHHRDCLKRQFQWWARGGTWQLINCLEWTCANTYANCELCPLSSDTAICCFI